MTKKKEALITRAINFSKSSKRNKRASIIVVFVVVSYCFVLPMLGAIQSVALRSSPRIWPEEWKTLTLEGKRYSLHYPANWDVFESPNGLINDPDRIAEISEKFRCNFCSRGRVEIAYKNMIDPTLDDVSAWSEERIILDAGPGSSVIGEFGEIQLDGQTVLIRSSNVNEGNYNENHLVPRLDALFLFDNDVFLISLISTREDFEELTPFYYEMIGTFQVIED